MLQKNMGPLDRALRLILGLALIPTGLFLLGGWQGHWLGIAVTVLALLPIATAAAGICLGYVPFGISTRRREHGPPM